MILYWSKQPQTHLDSREGVYRPYLLTEGVSKNLQPFIKTPYTCGLAKWVCRLGLGSQRAEVNKRSSSHSEVKTSSDIPEHRYERGVKSRGVPAWVGFPCKAQPAETSGPDPNPCIIIVSAYGHPFPCPQTWAHLKPLPDPRMHPRHGQGIHFLMDPEPQTFPLPLPL